MENNDFNVSALIKERIAYRNMVKQLIRKSVTAQENSISLQGYVNSSVRVVFSQDEISTLIELLDKELERIDNCPIDFSQNF